MQMQSLLGFFQRLLFPGSRGLGFAKPRSWLKWLLISTAIGLVAGVGAALFSLAIRLSTAFFLGTLVGYFPPDPAGEGPHGLMSLWAAPRPWLLPVVTGAGGLIAGIIVFNLAPEAEGHGTDAAIAAFHQGKAIRARIPLIKLVASAITIGSGGSGGREGPSAQISAGFGSLLSDLLHLDTRDRRLAIATGIGAGVGAIFRAPLGGAVLAAEILYRHDLEVEVIIPALIASIVGYSVSGSFSGWHTIFSVQGNLAFTSPPQLLYYALLGLLCGSIGRWYATGFYAITHFFERLTLPRWMKPGIGGLLVGLIGLLLPQTLSMGYGWVQISMGPGLLSLPLWVILLLPFARILTTGLSIGSGGSGGVFGPGMVIGAAVGASIWRIGYHLLPGLPATPAPFVIVGMMALFGGIAHAPLAVMLMVAEMSGNLSMLAPAMIAVGLSSLISGNHSIYTSQVATRADSPAHHQPHARPLLSALTVSQAMIPSPVRLTPQQLIVEAEHELLVHAVSGAPVLDASDLLVGTLTLADLQQLPLEQRTQSRVEEVLKEDTPVAHPEDTLDTILDHFFRCGVDWMPVIVDEAGRRHLLGAITVQAVMHLYRERLENLSQCPDSPAVGAGTRTGAAERARGSGSLSHGGPLSGP